MKKFKVTIIMIALLMVLNASASEMQHSVIMPSSVSEQADKPIIAEEQVQQAFVLLEGATDFCEEKMEDT